MPHLPMESIAQQEEASAATAARILGRWAGVRKALLCLLGGACYAAALPPWNLFFLAPAAPVPLVWCAVRCRNWYRAFWYGWLWGVAWTLGSCWFLREIEFCVPFLLAPVLGCWSGVWSSCLPFLWKYLFYPASLDHAPWAERMDYEKNPRLRNSLAFLLTAGALFTLLEWTRSRLFVWNDFSVTQWRNLPLIQIASVTGSYGVGFLSFLPGVALALWLRSRGRKNLFLAAAALLPACGAGLWGFFLLTAKEPGGDTVEFRPALIQGDLSQRRHATTDQSEEAMEIYFSLSRQAWKRHPQLLIWPESAIPVPLRGNSPEAELYRERLGRLLTETGIPMLIGALDFSRTAGGRYGVTNSALLISADGKLAGKYDKCIRVPYGEFIPGRRFLPESLIRYIDMGRDLTPGQSCDPLPAAPGIRAGLSVCYEGVFACHTRALARCGANVLIVLSNDAWYPRSSEPEQHLANAVMRAVETGLPMIRCGNNGGSGVVTPRGRFTQSLLQKPGVRPELLRGRGWNVLSLRILKEPRPTFYIRWGEWFIGVLALIAAPGVIRAFRRSYLAGKFFADALRPARKSAAK